MKKVLFICFALVLCLCLSTACFAEGNEAQDGSSGTPTPTTETSDVDIKEYIQEKIVPVAVGVLTAVIAFAATLYKIASVLKSLKEAGRAIDTEGKIRKELKVQAQELKEGLSEVPALARRLEELQKQVATLSEILTLGFCANEEIIRSGKGKKMAVLLENAKASPHPSAELPPSPTGEG